MASSKTLFTPTPPQRQDVECSGGTHHRVDAGRDWAAERTNTPREVVEAALAHTVQNPTEAADARSDLFERRRRLMDEWAAYLSGAREAVVAWKGAREQWQHNG